MRESYLKNCLIVVGDGLPAGGLFGMKEVNGMMVADYFQIDGYAIIPMARYEALLSMKSGATEPPDPSARV